jgi:hypothetical protein
MLLLCFVCLFLPLPEGVNYKLNESGRARNGQSRVAWLRAFVSSDLAMAGPV